MSKLVALAIALLALVLAPATYAATSEVRVHDLPGATAFPESIGVDQRTGEYFTGSFLDGSMYRGALASSQAELFLPAGSDGRTHVSGVKVDHHSRIWVADAFNGRVLVYDEAGNLLHTFLLTGPGTPLLNDLAISHGSVFVTDSARPFLYRLREQDADTAGVTTVAPWMTVDPPVIYTAGKGPAGINLNGIVASPDGSTLLTVQSNTGDLFRVDVARRSITQVATPSADLLSGDGLLRVGDDLYVALNAANQIAVLRLDHGWKLATLEATITNDAFANPTGLADLRSRLLVTNLQLSNAAHPVLPFTILDFPLR